MDNLRPLSSSLPTRRSDHNSAELLSSFKAAALSVTNLYKTAAADQARSRHAGYQDALDDLLAFLDREKLGLMDGEGWRVRAWATGRLDDRSVQRHAASSEDEAEDTAKRDENAARRRAERRPVENHTSSAGSGKAMSLKENAPAPRHSSEPPQAQLSQTQHTSVMPSLALPTANDFAFRSEHQMPSNHDRQDAGMELDSVTSTGPPSATSSTDNGSAAIRIVPRHRRDKHNNRRRDNQQQPALNFNLGSGAGNKRKMPYPDFFDISGVSSEGPDWKKDGSNSGGNNGMRGGKRGRHV